MLLGAEVKEKSQQASITRGSGRFLPSDYRVVQYVTDRR